MLYCSIASGSKGNCHFILGEHTAILVDAGTTAKNIAQRLAEIGVDLCHITAILLTHEHIDHISALEVLLKRTEACIYCNQATMEAVLRRFPKADRSRFTLFCTEGSFYINELSITAFATPHDAAESVGYSISCGLCRVCIATDIGHMTAQLLSCLEGAQLVCLESNHDEQMLAQGPYPFTLKRRIMGSRGHLSNRDCAQVLKHLADKGLRQAVLCHLSQQNNTAQLAFDTVKEVLACAGADIPVEVALQDSRSRLYSIVPVRVFGQCDESEKERTASEGRMRPQKIRAVKQL